MDFNEILMGDPQTKCCQVNLTYICGR